MDLSAIIPTTSDLLESGSVMPKLTGHSSPRPEPEDNKAMEGSKASSDSGSLTQRAAMIRDELLGNDSLEHSSEHGSESSSGDSGVVIDPSEQQEVNEEQDDELEQRLGNSNIAHSLRHIALAFDEKVCCTSVL